MEMEAVKVKVLKSVFVEQTGLKYKAGQEVEVPSNVAKRQVEVENFELIEADKKEPVDIDKKAPKSK